MRPMQRPTLGEPAPLVRAVDAGGRPWRLEDHRGQHVVLIFHRHIH